MLRERADELVREVTQVPGVAQLPFELLDPLFSLFELCLELRDTVLAGARLLTYR